MEPDSSALPHLPYQGETRIFWPFSRNFTWIAPIHDDGHNRLVARYIIKWNTDHAQLRGPPDSEVVAQGATN